MMQLDEIPRCPIRAGQCVGHSRHYKHIAFMVIVSDFGVQRYVWVNGGAAQEVMNSLANLVSLCDFRCQKLACHQMMTCSRGFSAPARDSLADLVSLRDFRCQKLALHQMMTPCSRGFSAPARSARDNFGLTQQQERNCEAQDAKKESVLTYSLC